MTRRPLLAFLASVGLAPKLVAAADTPAAPGAARADALKLFAGCSTNSL